MPLGKTEACDMGGGDRELSGAVAFYVDWSPESAAGVYELCNYSVPGGGQALSCSQSVQPGAVEVGDRLCGPKEMACLIRSLKRSMILSSNIDAVSV